MSETTDNRKAGGRCAPAPGSAFVLIKTKGAESCSLTFWSEAELRDHLEAMWSVTGWHLAAVVQVPQNK